MQPYQVLECSHAHNRKYMAHIYRLRHDILYQQERWDIKVKWGLELDRYDLLRPSYLVAVDGSGNLVGCVRMLDTDGPHMLPEAFPQLLGASVAPTGPRCKEASRFAVDTERYGDTTNGLNGATVLLLAAVLEWSLRRDVEKIVVVVSCKMARLLKNARWPLLKTYADPQPMQQRTGFPNGRKDWAVAGELAVSHAILRGMRQRFQLSDEILSRTIMPVPA